MRCFVLDEEMVAMFNAYLVETDSQGSESDGNREEDFHDDKYHWERGKWGRYLMLKDI